MKSKLFRVLVVEGKMFFTLTVVSSTRLAKKLIAEHHVFDIEPGGSNPAIRKNANGKVSRKL
jgi:hypothetical protein